MMIRSQPRLGEIPLCPELPIPQTISVRGLCVPVEWRTASFGSQSEHDQLRHSDQRTMIRLEKDLDFTFPWQVPLICLTLTWGLGLLTLLCVLFFPVQSILTILVCAHIGLLGQIIYLFVRLALLRYGNRRISWGNNSSFSSLETYSLATFGVLITVLLLILIFLDLMLFLFRRNEQNWRSAQIHVMRVLLQLVSDASRELPSLIIVLPLFYLLGLYILTMLCGFIIVQMCTIVEPVRMKFTGCLALMQHSWVQYGLIPAHLLYSLWMLRFYMALCQVSTSVLVNMWYNAAATKAGIPVSRFVSTIYHKIRKQALGSIGFASLLSTLTWFPLQVLTCLRTVIRQQPLEDDQGERAILQRLWTMESLLRQLDCNIYTIMTCDQKSFSKSWSHLNAGICEQTVPIKLVELMRWSEALFTVAKWACTTCATLFAFAYFSTKPPISHIFPILLALTLVLSYLTATTVVGILQHLLSTIMICFCLQEEQRFANEVLNEQVMIGFRHDEVKSKLAFLSGMDSTNGTSSPILLNRKRNFPGSKNMSQNRNRTIAPLDMNRNGGIEEISV